MVLFHIRREFGGSHSVAGTEPLFDACPSPRKRLLRIPGADHNSVLLHGLEAHLAAVVQPVSSSSHPSHERFAFHHRTSGTVPAPRRPVDGTRRFGTRAARRFLKS